MGGSSHPSTSGVENGDECAMVNPTYGFEKVYGHPTIGMKSGIPMKKKKRMYPYLFTYINDI